MQLSSSCPATAIQFIVLTVAWQLVGRRFEIRHLMLQVGKKKFGTMKFARGNPYVDFSMGTRELIESELIKL